MLLAGDAEGAHMRPAMRLVLGCAMFVTVLLIGYVIGAIITVLLGWR